MVAKIKIGNATVDMVANGATPIRYRAIFGEDIIRILLSQEKGVDTGVMTDAAGKLAYIMHLQAEKSDFRKVNHDTFIAWMEEFEPMDLIYSAGDIMNFYSSQALTTSVAKKKELEQTET